MSKASEALREIGIYNGYEAAKRGVFPVYLNYRPADNGRASQSAAWQVIDVRGRVTDDRPKEKRHWRDYGHKTFMVWGRENKAPVLEAAKEWVAEKTGITEWGTIPGIPGAYFPTQTVEAVKAALKHQERSGER